MNHYLEIIEIERGESKFYELLLHSGGGVETYTGSHSHSRLVKQAEHIADVLALDSKTRLKIIDNVEMTGKVAI